MGAMGREVQRGEDGAFDHAVDSRHDHAGLLRDPRQAHLQLVRVPRKPGHDRDAGHARDLPREDWRAGL